MLLIRRTHFIVSGLMHLAVPISAASSALAHSTRLAPRESASVDATAMAMEFVVHAGSIAIMLGVYRDAFLRINSCRGVENELKGAWLRLYPSFVPYTDMVRLFTRRIKK